MSVLNVRIEAEAEDRDGKAVSVSPGAALWRLGPRVQVTLSPLEAQIKSLTEKGKAPAAPAVGWGLIDTGAYTTCVDRTAAENVGLAIVDTGPMGSATHDNEIVPIFSGRVHVEGIPRHVDMHRAYGANLHSQGLIALIGRDLLASCVLVYNGLDDSFSLSI